MVTKLDPKKGALKSFYFPPVNAVALVDVPPLTFLMIDGSGDPNTSQVYQDAVQTLYSVSYTLKFISKAAGIDYVVMPLEGLWWCPDMAQFSTDDKSNWLWTAMIMQPEHVSAAMVEQAIADARAKKDPPALDRLRFEPYHEGLSAQIMHIGPYAAEGPTIERLHRWITDNGYDYHGANHHHEIYLSDPRRTAPDKLKTVVRQPVLSPGA